MPTSPAVPALRTAARSSSPGDDLVVCRSDVCRAVFLAADGWGGYCVWCVTVLDDHAVGRHDDPRAVVEGCPDCA